MLGCKDFLCTKSCSLIDFCLFNFRSRIEAQEKFICRLQKETSEKIADQNGVRWLFDKYQTLGKLYVNVVDKFAAFCNYAKGAHAKDDTLFPSVKKFSEEATKHQLGEFFAMFEKVR